MELTDKQRHYINEYEHLNKTFPNIDMLLFWAETLRPILDRHQFMGCLPDVDKDISLSYFLEFIETIPSLNPQQVQWVKECVPKNGYVLQDTTGPSSYGQTIVTQPVLQSVASPQMPTPTADEQTAAAPTTKRKTKDPLEVFPKKVRKQARQYFDKAIKIGLMDKKYHWLKTKVPLACFAFGVSRALELNDTIKVRGRDDEYKYISWIPFEKIFGVKGKPLNLRGSLNDCIKREKEPKHYDLILKIFPNLNILAD